MTYLVLMFIYKCLFLENTAASVEVDIHGPSEEEQMAESTAASVVVDIHGPSEEEQMAESTAASVEVDIHGPSEEEHLAETTAATVDMDIYDPLVEEEPSETTAATVEVHAPSLEEQLSKTRELAISCVTTTKRKRTSIQKFTVEDITKEKGTKRKNNV